MAFSAKTWVDRDSQYPTRRKITNVDDISDVKVVTVERDEGTVTTQGDAFDAANMNNLEGRIAAMFTDVTGTLVAGSTSVTLSSASITTDSTIDVYVDSFGINPTGMSVVSGSVTLTFEAQQSNLGVKVRVY